MNILCVIDVWEHLGSAIENEVKANLCFFLQKIKDNPDWFVYFYAGDTEPDPDVMNCVLLCNHEVSDNSLDVFNPYKQDATYFFAGFHTNYCIFDSKIGVQKMLQLNNSSNFFIVDDLTACVLNDDKVIVCNDLEYYNAGNSKLSEQEINAINLRVALIQKSLVKSSMIL